jgi:hypothetical protein
VEKSALDRVFRLAGTVVQLPALRIAMIAPHSRVTMFAKTGDYNSCTALRNTRYAAFYFFNSGGGRQIEKPAELFETGKIKDRSKVIRPSVNSPVSNFLAQVHH